MTATMTATAGSADDARAAVEALSLHGVEGRRIRVVDPAGGPDDRARDQRTTDARVVRRLGGRMGRGLLVGVLAGAVLGALVVGVVASAPSSAVLGALSGAIAGAGLGALVGLQATPTMSTAWEDANAPGPGVRHVIVDEVDDVEREDLRSLLEEHARDVRITGA